MKLRSFFSILVASVLVLLLVGASGFYWLTARSPLALLRGGPTDGPAAAMFVPKQAPAVVSLLVNPERLEAFRQVVAAPKARRQSKAEIEQLKQSLLANTGLDYKQDVEPWLGDEITLALTSLDVDRDPKTGQQPGYLLAIATQNPERSREFLQLFWQKRAAAGTELVFEQYKGVKLIYGQPELEVQPQKPAQRGKKNRRQEPDLLPAQPATTLTTAVVGDRFVLFANQPKVLRDAINNVQAAELGLRSSPEYQRALQSFQQRQIGLVFLNLPQLAAWSGQITAADNAEVSNLYESIAIGLGLSRKGLLAETAFLAAPGQTIPAATPALSQPSGALEYIPASSSVVAAGTDLQQLWTQVSEGVSGYITLAQLINQPLANLQSTWQLDLPQDIFSWVQGEYALALLPRPEQQPEQQPDWIFVTQRTEAATTAIANLDTLAQERGFSVGPLTLADRPVSAWTKLGSTPLTTTGKAQGKPQSKNQRQTTDAPSPNVVAAEVEGVHATVGNYEIFATSVEAMEQALQATTNSFIGSPGFKAAIATLPKDNNGYLYVDWANSRSLLEKQLPVLRLVELAGQPFWSHLRSLTVTSLGGETGVRRGEVFLNLSATDKA